MAQGSQPPAAVPPPQPPPESEAVANDAAVLQQTDGAAVAQQIDGAAVEQQKGETEAIKQDALAGAGADSLLRPPLEGHTNIHAGLTEEEQDALLKVSLDDFPGRSA